MRKKICRSRQSYTASSGRLVQCGSCGNKWKQFPIKMKSNKLSRFLVEKKVSKPKQIQQKIQKTKKIKKKSLRENLEK